MYFLPTLAFAGRVLMSLIFLIGGIGKFTAQAATLRSMIAYGVPLPELVYWGALATEIGGGLLLLFGMFTRPVALLLAVFCLITAFVFHDVPSDPAAMLHFYKNLCMAGGLLQLAAFGSGLLSIDTLILKRLAAPP